MELTAIESWIITQQRDAGIQVHELNESPRIIAAPVVLKSDQ
jgi:hypothetical protein